MVQLKLGAFDQSLDLGDREAPDYRAKLAEWCAERARAQASLDRALARVLDAATEYRLTCETDGAEECWGRSLDDAIDQVLDAAPDGVLSLYDTLRAI